MLLASHYHCLVFFPSLNNLQFVRKGEEIVAGEFVVSINKRKFMLKNNTENA